MSAPLTIRFATDHAAAKAGIQDLAASVVAGMVKVSDALNTGIQANGGYAGSVRTLAANVADDLGRIGAAGVKAATDSNYSAVATATAMAQTVASTQSAAVVARGSWAVASESARFNLAIVRNEAAATARLLSTSPLVINVAGAIVSLVALKVAFDATLAMARAGEQALDDMIKVGTDAGKAGVSTGFLQVYREQAKALRIEAADLAKSLAMARDAFTVRQGEGGEEARNESAFAARLRRQVAAGNVSQAQADRVLSADGLEAQLRAALDVMTELQQAGRELAALDLAERLFPPAIVERLRQGTLEFERLRAAAETARNPQLALYKPEDIVRAQELQRRLDEASAKLEQAGKIFRADLMEAGIGLKEDAAAWKEAMASGTLSIAQALRDAKNAYWQSQEGLPAGGDADLVVRGGRVVSRATTDATIAPSGRGHDYDDALLVAGRCSRAHRGMEAPLQRRPTPHGSRRLDAPSLRQPSCHSPRTCIGLGPQTRAGS